MVYLTQILQCLLLGMLMLTTVNAAPQTTQLDAKAISAKTAGLWYNRHHDGEGFSIQVSDSGKDGGLFTVTWYTYDNQRQQMWLIGSQQYTPGESMITVALVRPTGTRFGSKFDSEEVSKPVWGLMTFDFLSCNEATATINTSTGFGTGVIPLNKLSDNSGAPCTNLAIPATPPFYSDAGGVPTAPPQQGLGEGVFVSKGDHTVDGISVNVERLYLENGQCSIEVNLSNQTNTNRSVKLVYYFFFENKQVAFSLFEHNFVDEKEITLNRKILSVSSPTNINCNAFDEVKIESLAAQESF